MFKTKNLVNDVKSVPPAWIFEHYCKLTEKLTGQDVKIKSLFNTKDKVPSMIIYFKYGAYRYNDFSSGKKGSAVNLIQELYSLSFKEASEKIVSEYNEFILHNNGGYDIKEFKERSRYKVDKFTLRDWNRSDAKYWTAYNIGTKLLNNYNVKPLESYHMVNDDKELEIKNNYIYGFFKKDGTLYKIYQPLVKEKKFIKIHDYIQGSEQLENHKFLVIISSLKDAMAFKSFGLHVDVVAPDSENTLIRHDIMEGYLSKYEKVIIFFDNDEAGIKAMAKYQEKYPAVATMVLVMSKDISDSIKDHGARKVYFALVSLLNKKLNS